MKRFFLILLIALTASGLWASRAGTWDVGIEAGYTLGLYDQKGGLRDSQAFSPGHAFSIGGTAEYHFTDWLSLSTGLLYESRAYGSTLTYADAELFEDMRYAEHFFDIPLTVRFSLGNDFVRGFAGIGGYIGVRFLSEEGGLVTNMHEDLVWHHGYAELNPGSDNLFDAGLLAELGAGFSISSGELYIALRYKYALTALNRNYQENQIMTYLDTFSASVGWTFRLGGAS